MRLTAGNSYECALKFSKVYQNTWSPLTELAKKWLYVSPTSVSAKRIQFKLVHIQCKKKTTKKKKKKVLGMVFFKT
jgi:hypothetical protein